MKITLILSASVRFLYQCIANLFTTITFS